MNTEPFQQKQSKTEILTILSIILPFVGLSLIGLLLSIYCLHSSKLKTSNKNLVKISIVLNSIILAMSFVLFSLFFTTVYKAIEQRALDNKEKTSSALLDENGLTKDLVNGMRIIQLDKPTSRGQELISKINSITDTPQDEVPYVYILIDETKIPKKNLQYYYDIKEGDIVFVYPESGKMIIYREKTNIIIHNGQTPGMSRYATEKQKFDSIISKISKHIQPIPSYDTGLICFIEVTKSNLPKVSTHNTFKGAEINDLLVYYYTSQAEMDQTSYENMYYTNFILYRENGDKIVANGKVDNAKSDISTEETCK